MGYYAKIEDDRVTQIIVSDASPEDGNEWLETTRDTSFRGNFGNMGSVYDRDKDVFYPEQPYPSWVLDESIYSWKPPIAWPDREDVDKVVWDEDTTSWKEITE